MGALHGPQGDGPIEGGKSAVIPNSQTKQIRIRDLLVSADRRQPKQRVVRQRNGVWPEMLVRHGASVAQAAGYFGGPHFRRPIGRVAQNANAAIYGYWAGCPSVPSIPAEPAVRVFVVDMGRVEESHQDIYVKQGNAHASVPQLVYQAEIGLRGAGPRREKQKAVPHLLGCFGGERLPGQCGDDLPERHAFQSSQFTRAGEEVVVEL